ncbi:flagellar protein FlaG [Alteromonas sp. a30]|uniref:flagellar protein FlaG n=1 Tax=Alteromonas sp. a30 TaxID=2730917 RepID=UPI002280FC06|nr:flagellar protein FlaG [Alteromonas sp. a30]MCY7294535.1 flagellar protein FlaG [Alteromonas sp. a30]
MDVDLTRSSELANVLTSNQNASERLSESRSLNAEVSGPNSTNASSENADIQGNSVELNPANLESAVGEVSEFVQSQNRNLNFSFNEDSGRSIVQVTDSETGELIRQIPSEEVLRLSERIKNLQTDVGAAVGVLFNKEV